MEAVRLRLVFPKPQILSKTQNSEELNRSWLLLNPTLHPTIADVSSHLTRIFNLNHSCPHGISLSMDGYVLPPFESTCILKDNDLIRVKRKKRGNSDETVNITEEKNPEGNNVLLLGNGELNDEIGNYQNEFEEREENMVEDLSLMDQSAGEIADSKKRKISKKLRNAKIKRKAKTSINSPEVANEKKMTGKEAITEKQHVDTNKEFETETNDFQIELQEREDNVMEGSLLVKNSAVEEAFPKKRKAFKELESLNHRKKKKRAVIHQEIETDVQAEQHDEPCHSPKRKKKSSVAQQDTESDFHVEPNKNSGMSSEMNVDNIKNVSDLETEHVRESFLSSGERNNEFVEHLPIPESVLHENGTVSVGLPHKSEGNKKISRSTRRIYEKRKFKKELKAEVKELLAEKVLIPHTHSLEMDNYPNGVVVRPGHIRFEPYEKDRDVQQNRVVVETFGSIGTASKRENKKRVKEKIVYCTRSKCKDYSDRECEQVVTIENAKSQNNLSEFNRLPLLTCCPKEGDVIAYRVLEQLSESGPILSSFRVGKTIQLDNWMKKLLLTPVEENQVTYLTSGWGSWEKKDNSIDKETENIEIDVASLYDVRIVKHAPGNEPDVWDSLSQASSVKNSLLTRKREWGKVGPVTNSVLKGWGKVGSTATPTHTKWNQVAHATATTQKKWGDVVPTTTSVQKEWGKAGSTTQKRWGVGPTTTTNTNSWSSEPFNSAKQSQNGHSKSKW